jgi:hypothetical protein
MIPRLAILLALLPIAGFAQAPAQNASSRPGSAGEAQVWSREADYWRFAAAGDAESYESLWHHKFIGWPCDLNHPVGKASVGDWVRDIRDKHVKVAANVTREGAENFGNVVVVHYRLTRVDTYPDGKIEGKGAVSKITHTWMKFGKTWLIIGGMCGALPDNPR